VDHAKAFIDAVKDYQNKYMPHFVIDCSEDIIAFM
jgi:hypothetical protein